MTDLYLGKVIKISVHDHPLDLDLNCICKIIAIDNINKEMIICFDENYNYKWSNVFNLKSYGNISKIHPNIKQINNINNFLEKKCGYFYFGGSITTCIKSFDAEKICKRMK